MRLNASSYSARILHHVWWCYRASVCAFGITSLSLSDSCNISFILSHSESPNHQPTDTLSLSQSTQSQRTDVPRWHDGTTALHTTVQSLIYEVDLAYQPTRRAACRGCQCQPGSATFQTRGPRPCGGWKNQPAQVLWMDDNRQIEGELQHNFNLLACSPPKLLDRYSPKFYTI